MWTLLLSVPALACGGMFCDTQTGTRIDQAGERIIFAVDPVEDCVEMHVEVAFEGSASEFAWLIPVPDVPDLSLSTTVLFDALDTRTAPNFNLTTQQADCAPGGCNSGKDGTDSDADFDEAGEFFDTDVGSFVDVAAEERVGPYETVTLRGSSGAAIIDWLQTSGFELPTNLDAALNPYVDEESWFVAMRLANDEAGGVLDPIALKFAGTTTPTIPLRLTAVAATDDMPITTWVLGSQTYAPSNMALVGMNTARLDWWGAFANYTELLSEAVDEAGGEAWVVESVDDPRSLGGTLYAGLSPDALTDELIGLDPVLFKQSLSVQWERALSTELPNAALAFLARCIDTTDQPFSGEEFWESPVTWADDWDDLAWDPDACADLTVERWFEPRFRASRMLQNPVSTRLTTTISANEMQTDPEFGPTVTELGSMPTSSSVEVHCDGNTTATTSPRTWSVEDYEVPLPSTAWLADNNGFSDWIALADTPAAATVDLRQPDGTLERIVDHRDDIADALSALRKEGPAGEGCGCTGSRRASSGLALMLLVALRRRR